MARTGVTPAVIAAVIDVAADDWREAIRDAAGLLLRNAAAEPRYVDACVAMIEDHGPYIVVAPGTALAHARPEDGATELGLSVVVLGAPVAFGHPSNDPVDVVFAFGSPDREKHVGLLAALSRHLRDGLADRLRGARTDGDATRFLAEVIDDVHR